MRLDLRLIGRTAGGRKCQADVSVYASSRRELQREADLAARKAAWLSADPPYDPIPDGSRITIEHVERIGPPPSGAVARCEREEGSARARGRRSWPTSW